MDYKVSNYYSYLCTIQLRMHEIFCYLIGGIAAVAIDERGLDEYSELFEEVRTLDGLLTHVVGSGTIPDDVLDVCEISAYITTTSKCILFQ